MTQIIMIIGGLGFLLLVSLSIFMFFKLRHKDKSKTPEAARTSTLLSSIKGMQERSEIILNTISDAVVLVDSAGTIQLFNPSAARMTGWAQSDATGINHHAVVEIVNDKGMPYDTTLNPLDKVFVEENPIRDNNGYLKSRSGTLTAIAVSVSPLKNSADQTEGAVAILRDVSEERKEEKQRAEFISTASHEMRTPVAAIEGYLALALNEKVAKIDSKARDYLEKAHSSTVHLGKLFQDLLTAAKSEDGRLANHPVVVELGHFLQELSDGMRFSAEKKGLQLEFLIGLDAGATTNTTQKVIAPLYFTHVDPERIREVITNLFDNAVKYSDQGKIAIGLSGDDKVVQFRISDTGQGIPAEDIPHLFQKFYRVDNSATRTIGGTGLGLFICRKIVELYNGRIWVESVQGKGSTFYINLPRLSAEKAAILSSQEANQAAII